MKHISNNDTSLSSQKISFADVAHHQLTFDKSIVNERLILDLIDCRWIQRLRDIRQTGNTNLVYMFSEHSRFGHSLGVAYLATLLMKHLSKKYESMVKPYLMAVSAAAILHDIGHVAPGSHLAERVWASSPSDQHEQLTLRIIQEDHQIQSILNSYDTKLAEGVMAILSQKHSVPDWAKSVISGEGWNADRGNWAIVDSAMCSVSYGRYNVEALIDAFRLTAEGQLVLQENRLDALTHFFLARDSMYRQVYQHRVIQATDKLTELIILRLRDICQYATDCISLRSKLASLKIFCDETMASVLASKHYTKSLSLETVFDMTESWWNYHLCRWCISDDPVVRDLAIRLRERKLFKTIRLEPEKSTIAKERNQALIKKAKDLALEQGLDPKYYVVVIDSRDKHRHSTENTPFTIQDNGELVKVTEVEPLLRTLLENSENNKIWLAVPKIIKDYMGRIR